MPILVFILVVVLIAQLGFWTILKATLGAILFFIVFALIVAGIIVFGGLLLVRSLARRL